MADSEYSSTDELSEECESSTENPTTPSAQTTSRPKSKNLVNYACESEEIARLCNAARAALYEVLNPDHFDGITVLVNKVTQGSQDEANQQPLLEEWDARMQVLLENRADADSPLVWDAPMRSFAATFWSNAHSLKALVFLYQWMTGDVDKSAPSTKKAIVEWLIESQVAPATHLCVRSIVAYEVARRLTLTSSSAPAAILLDFRVKETPAVPVLPPVNKTPRKPKVAAVLKPAAVLVRDVSRKLPPPAPRPTGVSTATYLTHSRAAPATAPRHDNPPLYTEIARARSYRPGCRLNQN
jgi:hypothetical protein